MSLVFGPQCCDWGLWFLFLGIFYHAPCAAGGGVVAAAVGVVVRGRGAVAGASAAVAVAVDVRVAVEAAGEQHLK